MAINDTPRICRYKVSPRLYSCLHSVAWEALAEVVREHGEEIFAKLSKEGRVRLLKEGRTLQAQEARLRRIDEAIQVGRWLIDRHQVETLGELPQGERLEFARLWSNAIGGARPHEH